MRGKAQLGLLYIAPSISSWAQLQFLLLAACCLPCTHLHPHHPPYTRAGMTTLQREERNGLRDEEEAGGPMYLLPPDSEGNDAEDDKLVSAQFAYTNPKFLAYEHHRPIHLNIKLSLKNLLPAVFVSVGPTSSNPFEQASSLSPSPKSPPRGRWKDGFCDWHKDCLHSCTYKNFFYHLYVLHVRQTSHYYQFTILRDFPYDTGLLGSLLNCVLLGETSIGPALISLSIQSVDSLIEPLS